MLDDQDLKKIHTEFVNVYEEIIAPKIGQEFDKHYENNIAPKIGQEFGNFYEQTIAPQFEELREEIGGIKGEINEIHSTMATKKDIMDTRDYLADKIADLAGETVVRDKRLEEKIDAQTDIMASHKLINETDLERLGQIKVFPKLAE